MNKPASYDTVKVGGDFTPIIVGGHHMVIKNVEETTSKGGKAMLKVSFDFAKNDSQPEYMMNEFKNDIRPDKKWPHVGTAYILTEDNDGNCSKKFKGFITSFERSNNCEAVWGEKFAAQFKNKKIGGVFGKVENEYNGKVTMRTELRWFCEDGRADSADIPAEKYLNNSGSSSNNSQMVPDDIVNGTGDADEIIPF